MATLDKEFIDNIIANNGFYDGVTTPSPDNPRCIKIVEYTNAWGRLSYGAVFEGEHSDPDRYEQPTEYVVNPRVYWKYRRD